jgi:hypothetical protein
LQQQRRLPATATTTATNELEYIRRESDAFEAHDPYRLAEYIPTVQRAAATSELDDGRPEAAVRYHQANATFEYPPRGAGAPAAAADEGNQYAPGAQPEFQFNENR